MSVSSSLTSLERRDERHSGLLLSSPSPTVSHPLLSPPPSVCEERCSRLSSILLSSLSGLSCSLSLSLSLMLALIPPALLPPPSLPLSLSPCSVSHLCIYESVHACTSSRAPLTLMHIIMMGAERERVRASMNGGKKRMRCMKSALNAPPMVT